MISQTYLIYLGIAVVIIIIAFFAYQELQKHKMEIQKLRFQSEKLRKIVHAYNMQQWAQQTGYPEESETEEEEEEEEEEPLEEHIELTGDDARQVVNEILKEAMSVGAANQSQPQPRVEASPASPRFHRQPGGHASGTKPSGKVF